MTVRPWRRAALAWLLVTSVGTPPRATAAEFATASIAVTIVAPSPCAPQLHERVAEQLADLAAEISWECRPRFELKAATPSTPRPHVWIDLSVEGEGQLTVGDAKGQRFVVRRVPLTHGLDEIGREAIAHIVRSAALALFSGKSETLTRAQAEATLSTWSPGGAAAPAGTEARPPSPAERRRPPAEAAPNPAGPSTPTVERPVEHAFDGPADGPADRRSWGWRPAFEVGPVWSSQVFSRQILLVHEVALALAVSSAGGSWAFWSEGGYRLPATYGGDPVGVSLDAVSLRLGPSLSVHAGQSLAFTFALGAGAAWSAFTPRVGSNGGASFVPASDGRFLSFSGRASVSLAYRPQGGRGLGVALRLFCDATPADVHYDYQDAAGATHRVLSHFPVRPGVGLLVSWRSGERR